MSSPPVGGSAHDPGAHLRAGDWLHIGSFGQINIARGVRCGDEVGLGIGTRVFTHGAYLSEWDGFPVAFEAVTIGSRVWLPHAQVNPGVTIGDDVVVAAGSVVTAELASGSLAAGAPARVIGVVPAPPDADRRALILARVGGEIQQLTGTAAVKVDAASGSLEISGAVFDLDSRTVAGEVTPASEVARNQLRRRGIRFRYEPVDGIYLPWPESEGRG